MTTLVAHASAPAVERRSTTPLLWPGDHFVPFRIEELEHAVSRRFEQQVRQFPERLAIKDGSHELTYAVLNRLANRIARALLVNDGTAAEPVLLLLNKGVALIAAMLGVLKAGKFYVPLSPSYPAARNALIAEDSRARLIVADATNVDVAGQLSSNATVVNVDSLDPDLDDADLEVAVGPDDYAYIIYTSGSTGQPKGVLDTHRNLMQNIRRYINSHYLSDADRLICVNSCAFSNSLKDIYGALLNGGSVFPLDIEREGLAALAGLFARERITGLNAVATLFRKFVASLRDGDCFPDLRFIRLGSEAVTRKDLELFRQRFPRTCVLVNGYGSTETGTVRVNFFGHDSEIKDSILPIGYPVDGTDVLLLDDDGNPVETFQRVGQIAVRSPYLSPGYWGRPDLTDASFRPDPDGSSLRVYLTGDMAVLRPDGCLVYAGRKDFQVKIRGNRLDVAEIELVLMDSPKVAEAVVVKREDQPEDRALVAYVVPRDRLAAPPTATELRAWIKSRLPDYAVPASFVVLDVLPVTPTGKLNRKALPAPLPVRPNLDVACLPPRDSVETRLVELWQSLLGVRPIGVRDNFFDLGGNSLLAAQMFQHIGHTFRKELPLSALLHEGTIEHVARLLMGCEPAPERSCLLPLQPLGNKPPFYCVHGIGGEVLSLERLARYLGPDQPFYGFQARGLLSDEPPRRTIEEMAEAYVDQLLHFQPTGPYYLGGYSCGAAIAYEMAQRLQAAGHAVPLLVLIDQRRPNLDPAFAWSGTGILHLVRNIPWWLLDDLVRTSPSQLLSRSRIKLRMLRRCLASCLCRKPARAQAADMFDFARIPDSYRTLLDTNLQALRAYVPRPYAGRVVLFQARAQALFRWHEPLMGWTRLLTGPVEHSVIPGTHDRVLTEPCVRALATALAAALRRAAN